MANKNDIVTAVQNSHLFLKIPALKDAEVKLNKNGSPFVYAGGFNMVFQLSKGKMGFASMACSIRRN